MDEALRKSGEWPNVALIPGTHTHAATGEPVEQPENTRQNHGEAASDTQAFKPEPEPAREGGEPEIGEIAWHREVVDGYSPSDCPYCGCERVVVGEYEPCHDDEWSYCVEHKDAKRAVKRRCFTMYAAFKTPEDAVRRANRRVAQLAYVDVVSKPYGSLGVEPEPAAEENRQQDGSECDTREKLERDIKAEYYMLADEELEPIFGWLDRQAAITAEETSNAWEGYRDATQREIDELTAECDEWKAKAESALHENPYVGLVRGKQWEHTEISDYYCGRCGWKVTDHDSYCSECGGALHKASNKPDIKFDARKTAETPETCATKEHIRDFDDTREKLKKDLFWAVNRLWNEAVRLGRENGVGGYGITDEFYRLFDRQAAIIEREVLCQPDERDEQIAELTAECNKLREKLQGIGDLNTVQSRKIEELKAERDKLQEKVRHQSRQLTDTQNALEKRNEEIKPRWKRDTKKLQSRIDDLTAERDELQRQLLGNLDTDMAIENTQLHCEVNDLLEERDSLRSRLKTQADSFAKLERELHEAKIEAMHSQAQREELAKLNAEKRGTRKLPKKVVWPRDENGKPVKINALGAKNILFDSRTYLIEYWDGSTRYETYKQAKEALDAVEG